MTNDPVQAQPSSYSAPGVFLVNNTTAMTGHINSKAE